MKIRFLTSLVVGVIAVSIVPLAGVSIPMIMNIRSFLVKSAQNELDLNAKLLENKVDAIAAALAAESANLAANGTVRFALENPMFATGVQSLFSKLQKRLALVSGNLLFDMQGNLVTSYPEQFDELPQNIANSLSAWIQKGQKKAGTAYYKILDVPEWNKAKDSYATTQDTRYIFLAHAILPKSDKEEQSPGMVFSIIPVWQIVPLLKQSLSSHVEFQLIKGSEKSSAYNKNEWFVTQAELKFGTEFLPFTVATLRKTALAQADKATNFLIFACVLLVIGVGFGSFYFAYKLAHPISVAQAVAQEYAEGKYDQEKRSSRFLEIHALFETFYDMGQKIKQFIQSLEQYIADLQKLVRANQNILAKLDLESLQIAVQDAFLSLFPNKPLTFWTLVPTGFTNGKVVVCKDSFTLEQVVEGGIFPTGVIQSVIRDSKDSSIKAFIVAERLGDGSCVELSPAQKSLLEALSLAIMGALENIAALHEHKEKARMQAELETTRLVQRALLPQLAGSVHGLGVRTHFTPASECGGDWYGVYELENDEIVIFMGDVTGHGMPSAMLTAVVKGFCDSMRTVDPDKLDLQVFFKELNKIVFEVGEHQRLMTFCGIRFNTKTGKGIFINAGHNAPFIIRKENDESGERKVSRIMALGNRLGYVRENPVFAEKSFELREGDIVFLFTDGLVENKSPGGSQIGEKRVMALFRSLKDADLDAIATAVHNLYEEHIKDRSPDDDVTYLAFEWKNDEISYRSYPPMNS